MERSFKYGTLDYKWIARNQLRNKGISLENIKREHDMCLYFNTPEPEISKLLKMATSSFRYYCLYRNNIINDRSLNIVTSLCSSQLNAFDTEHEDETVFYLSRIFNKIVNSNRKLYKCYDCGTNARAVFLRLVNTIRGHPQSVTKAEQTRMSREYLVNMTNPVDIVEKCRQKLKSVKSDTVFIMSVSIENFGHVWVIEKRFMPTVRYHHYQSSLRSHILLDFIESQDYGRFPMKSMDIDSFMDRISYLMTLKNAWSEQDHQIFADLFAFLPNTPVTKPTPGFCYTWITY